LTAIKTMPTATQQSTLRVGELAKLTGKTVRALHLYEELKLLRPVSRSQGGYRLYGPDAIARIEWIAKLQTMGLSLPEIQQFLKTFESSMAAPEAMASARSVFETKLAETRAQIAQLRTLERDLVASLDYLASCSGCEPSHEVHECGVCDHHGHTPEAQPGLVAGLATARPYDRPETSLVRRPMALETKAKDTV